MTVAQLIEVLQKQTKPNDDVKFIYYADAKRNVAYPNTLEFVQIQIRSNRSHGHTAQIVIE